MSDIFNEVDEEVRRERLKQFWDRYNIFIIAAALVIVIGVGGWRAWQWWDQKQAAEAGAAYEAAARLAAEGKPDEAIAAFERVAQTGTSGYRQLARIREATELSAKDRPAAIRTYDALARESGLGQPLQDLLSIRAALLLIDTAPYEDIRQRLEPLAAEDRPFRYTARELLAMSAWRAGDTAAARRWTDMVMLDPNAPAGTRARVETIAALLGNERKG